MNRFLIFFMILGNVYTANSITMHELFEIGLPENAKPAKFFFERFYFDQSLTVTQFDVEDSSISTSDNCYYFFAQPHISEDEFDFTRVSLWVYDEESKRLSVFFNQLDSLYNGYWVYGIDWALNKEKFTKTTSVSDSKQQILIQNFEFQPVIILRAELWNGFNHAPQATFLLYPTTGEIKLIEKQKFIAVSNTLTNMLMAAEQDLAQDYIITTSMEFKTEDMELLPSEEISIYSKQHITPVMHFYSLDGVQVGTIKLKEDVIFMIR